MSRVFRSVSLRNNDPSIIYIGEWTSVEADTVVNFGNFGPAFSPTLHTTVSVASFSFSFIGSSMTVVGTINVANSSSADPNPTWECFIDGISLGPPNLSDVMENHWPLCSSPNFPDGAHELTVNVTSRGMPFYLDYISYRASPDVSLENSLIAIENPDPAIDYISGWSILGPGDLANQTSDPNGLVNVTFIGIQLSWYGFTLANETKASSWEYSIDGGSPTPFISPGSSPTAILYNQLFFITPDLDMGSHVLSVKYTGESGQTPLRLDWLLVANGSFPSESPGGLPTNSSGSGGIMNGPTAHSSNPSPSNNTGLHISDRRSSNDFGIVGGVVGSVVGIIVVFFFWFKFYRKRSQGNPLHEIMPFLLQPTPAVPSLPVYEVPNDHTRRQSKSNSNTNPNNIISLLTTPSAQSSSPAVAIVPSETESPRHPLSAISPVSSSNTYPRVRVQHEDSGIRLTPSVTDGEIEVPPTYTQQ